MPPTKPERVALSQLRADFPLYASLCLKIRPKGGGKLIPFELNQAQRIIWNRILEMKKRSRPPRLVVLKARREGVSTLAQGIAFHRVHLHENQQAMMIAHTRELASELLRMSSRFYRNLRKDLRYPLKYDTEDAIHFDAGDSRLQVQTAKATGGRGFEASILLLSELAWYQDQFGTFSAATASVPRTPNSLVIVESTANGVGNLFHDLYMNAKAGKSDYEAVFLPWFLMDENREPAHFTDRDLDSKERTLLEKYGLTLEQLSWRRVKVAGDFNGDEAMFNQEYPAEDHEAFIQSGRTVFLAENVAYYREHAPSTIEIDERFPRMEIEWDAEHQVPVLRHDPRGRLRIYRPPKPRHLYTLGSDPSSGDGPALPRPGDHGSDPCPAAVVCRMDLNLDAVWYGRTPPHQLAIVIRNLAAYYNRALANVEVNNHGLTTIDHLSQIYDNIYMRTSKEKLTGQMTQMMGWQTSEKTREYLINGGRSYVSQRLGSILDPNLLAEMEWMVYVRNKTGTRERADHPAGKTSDLVIAFCLALEACRAYPDAPLIPMALEELRQVRQEYQRALAEMGPTEANKVLDRMSMTAEELEDFDEKVYQARERQRLLGTGGMV